MPYELVSNTMQLLLLALLLVAMIFWRTTVSFHVSPLFHRNILTRMLKSNEYGVKNWKSRTILSDVNEIEVTDFPKHENLIGNFTKRFLCATVCPINRIIRHVDAWPDHMKWLKVAARYKPTRVAAVQAEHVMLSEDRTRPHAHLLFVDSNDPLDLLLHGMVDEPFSSKGGVREWIPYEMKTIVPWKPAEVLTPIFEHQAFVGRICNNQTTDESDRMLDLSAEYYRKNSDQILYAARLYPAIYGTMTMEEATALNLHRPIGDLVMLRTNSRSEAIQYLQGNPMLEGFTGVTCQSELAAANALNMTVSCFSMSGL